MMGKKTPQNAQGQIASVPRHVGIIMDGNGRWAKAKGWPRFVGHQRGVEAVRRTVKACIELGIAYLTIYSFSSENWSRPAQEVSDLLGLLKRFIRNDLAELHANNVRVRIIGEAEGLSSDLVVLLKDSEELTRHNTGLTLIVAFNYGSRQEIAAAMRRLAEQIAANTLAPAAITPELIAQHLDTAGIPDPDLIIRTSGEKRLSNFLMWQAAYAEFVFLDSHWPDFDRSALEAALLEYAARERRFGGVSEHEAAPEIAAAQAKSAL